jgi:hypothetical protein
LPEKQSEVAAPKAEAPKPPYSGPLEYENIGKGSFVVRPPGTLGTVGWIDGHPWQARFVKSEREAKALVEKKPQAEAPVGPAKGETREEETGQAPEEVLTPTKAELSEKYNLPMIVVSREATVPGTSQRFTVESTAEAAINDIDQQITMARSLLRCLST